MQAHTRAFRYPGSSLLNERLFRDKGAYDAPRGEEEVPCKPCNHIQHNNIADKGKPDYAPPIRHRLEIREMPWYRKGVHRMHKVRKGYRGQQY